MLVFMGMSLLILLGIATTLAYFLDDSGNPMLLSPALVCLLAVFALIGVRMGHADTAIQFLIWGIWIVIIASAPFGSGNRSVGIAGIPMLILMQGWMAGPRQAIAMTGATVMSLLGITLLEHFGWMPPGGPIPPLSRWLILSAVFIISGSLTVISRRLYIRRLDEQSRLTATLSMVAEHSPVMLAAVDGDGRFRYVNSNFASFYGKTPETLIGAPAIETLGSDTIRKIRQTLLRNTGAGAFQTQTASERWLEITARRADCLARNDDGYYAIQRDVTDEVRSAEQINFLAYHDALTGLPNRALMLDRLRQAIIRGAREDSLVAVCYVDLDGFRRLNDTWGHSAGDAALVHAASRLQECVRASDTVARLGSDEFVVLMGGIEDREEIRGTVDRLLHAVARPFPIGDDQALAITASIGVAVCPFDGSEPDTLLRNSDRAMLMAKQSGRNRIRLFDTELEQRAQTLHQMSARVDKGLADGEFVLYYLPTVNMREGTVTGVEALVRWVRPEYGLTLPAEFLPYLEGGPIAIRIGQWVLDETLSQMSRWARLGLKLPVSVNISSHHLHTAGFTEHLMQRLEAHPEIPAGHLEIETPESTVTEDMESAARIIRDSTALGVGFALDDFGTGYSSLTHFRRLPAGTLKIDQSLVRNILNDKEYLASVRGLVTLAHSFGRRIVAEGTETIEHGTALLAIGCEHAQGYGIAHPMPGDAVPAWVAHWQSPAPWLFAPTPAPDHHRRT